MARVFIELSTGVGPLIRCLPIALWLRDQGVEVRYFARDNSTRYFQSCGFSPIDIEPARVAFEKRLAPDWADVDEFWSTFGFASDEWLEDRIGVWKGALERYAPDVVIADLGVLSSITARLLSIPLAMITQSCFHPRVLHGTQRFWRPATPAHRTRDCVQRLLQRSGVSLRLERFEELFCGDRTLIPSLPAFDMLEPGRSYNEVFCGPILWDGLGEGLTVSEWPTLQADRPTTFVYTGRMRDSAGDSGELLLRAVLDCARRGTMNWVISTGGIDQIPADINLALPNVSVVDWVPVEVAYEKSDLVVHHGGHGSCVAALKYGVPSLIVPTHNEREYNARVMQRIGCADFIPKHEVTADRMLGACERLLTDTSTRAQLAKLQRLLASEYSDGTERAGRAILSLLG